MLQSLPFIILDSLVYASWLFLVASGLTLIYGVMKVLNIAHGSLYAFGAYSMAWLVGWFASNFESYEFIYFIYTYFSNSGCRNYKLFYRKNIFEKGI